MFAIVGASREGTWVKGSVASRQASLPVHFREIQHDRGPTGTLELHGRRGSRRDPKYPRRVLVGETLGPWRGGKGPIESGMLSDGSDTISGHVPVQGTQLEARGDRAN